MKPPHLAAHLRDDDRGGVTVFVVIVATALLAMAAISVDGGYVLAARERAHAAAAEAARAGAAAVNLDSVRSGGASIDPIAAQVAAHAVLAMDGLIGSTVVTGELVTVTVTTTTSTALLGMVGISQLTVRATATARDVGGVATVEP